MADNPTAAPDIQAELARLKGEMDRLTALVPPPAPATLLRLDLGCGQNKKAGFIGVDTIKFEGVDVVLDLGKEKWPWADSSVDEAYASHFIEHLKPEGRVHFVNELWRVLKPDAKATIITPHWSSGRAYGDLTHEWPAVAEFWYYYLSPEWRKVNAPHEDVEELEKAGAPIHAKAYRCNFQFTCAYSPHPAIAARSPEAQSWMLQFYKEAAQDMLATVIAKK